MTDLAILGGRPVRTKTFSSRPLIGEDERRFISECLKERSFSRFIGSPVGDFRDRLAMDSKSAASLEEFWSVLGGPYVRRFEAEFASKHQVSFAVSMNSATSCLTAAVLACGLNPGDEIITTPFSFTATATALYAAGAKVVFADIDPNTYCLDPQSVLDNITERTRAVVPVHILGNGGHFIEIEGICREKGLIIIEDSAQALRCKLGGRYLGSLGAVGVFSFQETKNIMTGEGGMAITNDQETAYRLRLIRNHGEAMVFDDDPAERIASAVGYNFRLPEVLAAVGYGQVLKLERVNQIRRENYLVLSKELEAFSFLRPQKVMNDPGQFFPYCIGFRYDSETLGLNRDLFAEALRAEGIPVSTGFPRLLSENLLFHTESGETPVAKRINYEEYLGFFQIGYPNKPKDMEQIAKGIKKIADHKEELISRAGEFTVSREFNSGRI
ncbi:DegT/DnrJ/EryC1/StrS family aminotransferase [Thermodesulfobacteriota bacterium]